MTDNVAGGVIHYNVFRNGTNQYIMQTLRVMAPLDTASMAIEQQAVNLHNAIDPLVIGRLYARSQHPAVEDGEHTSGLFSTSTTITRHAIAHQTGKCLR